MTHLSRMVHFLKTSHLWPSSQKKMRISIAQRLSSRRSFLTICNLWISMNHFRVHRCSKSRRYCSQKRSNNRLKDNKKVTERVFQSRNAKNFQSKNKRTYTSIIEDPPNCQESKKHRKQSNLQKHWELQIWKSKLCKWSNKMMTTNQKTYLRTCPSMTQQSHLFRYREHQSWSIPARTNSRWRPSSC